MGWSTVVSLVGGCLVYMGEGGMSLKTVLFGGAICVECRYYLLKWPGTSYQRHCCTISRRRDYRTGAYSYESAGNLFGHCLFFQPKAGGTEP